MKALFTSTLFFFLCFIHVQGYAQASEQQVMGSWKHHDVTDSLGAHVTIDLKPFDLTLSKDHRFVMKGDGMTANGNWILKNKVLTLNVAPSADVEGRVQKLYIHRVNADTLVLEVKDFEITGGLMIVLRRTK